MHGSLFGATFLAAAIAPSPIASVPAGRQGEQRGPRARTTLSRSPKYAEPGATGTDARCCVSHAAQENLIRAA